MSCLIDRFTRWRQIGFFGGAVLLCVVSGCTPPNYTHSYANVSSRGFLTALRTALQLYANDNENYFPPAHDEEGIECLVKAGYLPVNSVIRYPHVRRSADRVRFHYRYRGGLGPESPPSTPVAWDLPGNYEGFGYVLYYDHWVRCLEGSEWQEFCQTNPSPRSRGPAVAEEP